MDQAKKKDKPGLLANLKAIVALAPGIAGIAKKIPDLIDIVGRLF